MELKRKERIGVGRSRKKNREGIEEGEEKEEKRGEERSTHLVSYQQHPLLNSRSTLSIATPSPLPSPPPNLPETFLIPHDPSSPSSTSPITKLVNNFRQFC